MSKEYAIYRPKGKTEAYNGAEYSVITNPEFTQKLLEDIQNFQGIWKEVKIVERDVTEWRGWDGTS